MTTTSVLTEIAAERTRQNTKWGEQNHPDGTGNKSQQDRAEFARRWCQSAFASGYGTWADILTEEVAEAEAERDPAKLRAELVQAAAVTVAWIEAIDRRTHTNEQTVRACNGCNTPAHPYLNCDQAQQAREADRE